MRRKERLFVAFRMLTFFVPVALLLLMALSSCSSSSNDDEEDLGEDYDPERMEVCKHVAKVANQVKNDFFKECNNIGELASHAEEIKEMRYVKDVYFSSYTMFVDVEGYGPIFYNYLPKDNIGEMVRSEAQIQKLLKAMKTRADDETSAKYLNGYETAVVINQQFNEDRQDSKDAAEVALRALENCGVKCTPNNAPSVEFFQNELFDYDIVLLIGHGMWDPKRELHWLSTIHEVTYEEWKDFNADDFYRYDGYSRDEVTIGFNQYEAFGGKKECYANAMVSEKFINNAPRNFKKEGKVIFFNVACQSLMGGIPLETDEDLRKYSLAKILQEKGVGFYLGFDESSHRGAQMGGMLFMGKLASGFSLRAAYETLPEYCKHNHMNDKVMVFKISSVGNFVYSTGYEEIMKSWVADLLPFPMYSEINVGISDNYIVSPVIENYKDESSETKLKITLNATCPFYYDKDYLNTLKWGYYYVDNYGTDGCKYGFEYGTQEDFSDAVKTKKMTINTQGCSLSENIVSYSHTLTDDQLSPNTTYYYRAYIYDGYGYNYSNSDTFTTKDFPVDTSTKLPDVPGSDF
ncbi:MAG: fibronectin type III domain-containing protein [Prevotella sp.]|nr:fibronectin type III domain-containing protein [Prevotella sp.]